MKTLYILVIATGILPLQALAAQPVVSSTALHYAADQSVPPIAAHTPLPVAQIHNAALSTAKPRIKNVKQLRRPKHKTDHRVMPHRSTHQKSR